jgi:hypothetical protein
MTRARRRTGKRTARKKKARPASRAKAKRTAKPKTAASANPVPRDIPGPGSPTLRSQAQLEIRLERGARALTATEQAARLASAQMERRIGRLLSRRVKLKFRS